MTVLFIDTSNSEEIMVGLAVNGKTDELKSKSKRLRAQMVLPLIEKILKKHKITAGNLDEIKVNRGPGSFTGLRVGLAIANTLGFALKLSVNGKKQPLTPCY